jgi:hypothetical protein
MATNPTPLIVPCHRVLASGGTLGGYSAIGGLATKRRLLDMETDSLARSQRPRPIIRRDLPRRSPVGRPVFLNR